MKVIKAFRCKVTKQSYRVGETYDGDRGEELVRLGYVAAVESADEDAPEQPEKPKRKRKDSG